jgi:hypothetical protein
MPSHLVLLVIAVFSYVNATVLVAVEHDMVERHAELRLDHVLNLAKCRRIRGM